MRTRRVSRCRRDWDKRREGEVTRRITGGGRGTSGLDAAIVTATAAPAMRCWAAGQRYLGAWVMQATAVGGRRTQGPGQAGSRCTTQWPA